MLAIGTMLFYCSRFYCSRSVFRPLWRQEVFLAINERTLRMNKRSFVFRTWLQKPLFPTVWFLAGVETKSSALAESTLLDCRETIADFQYFCTKKFFTILKNSCYPIFRTRIQNYRGRTGGLRNERQETPFPKRATSLSPLLLENTFFRRSFRASTFKRSEGCRPATQALK